MCFNKLEKSNAGKGIFLITEKNINLSGTKQVPSHFNNNFCLGNEITIIFVSEMEVKVKVFVVVFSSFRSFLNIFKYHHRRIQNTVNIY